MRSQIRKIGNSRGVIIPAALLEACELGDEVDLRVEGKTLVIQALKIPRNGWFEGYQPEDDTGNWRRCRFDPQLQQSSAKRATNELDRRRMGPLLERGSGAWLRPF